MKKFEIPSDMLTEIYQYASENYPEECCGLIIKNKNTYTNKPCPNIQNILHDVNPKTYPRTAKDGYFISPKELYRANNEGSICVIYHSHIDKDAYFSEEDLKMATFKPTGEPLFPDVDYLVLSVKNGKTDHHNIYSWDENLMKFGLISYSCMS